MMNLSVSAKIRIRHQRVKQQRHRHSSTQWVRANQPFQTGRPVRMRIRSSRQMPQLSKSGGPPKQATHLRISLFNGTSPVPQAILPPIWEADPQPDLPIHVIPCILDGVQIAYAKTCVGPVRSINRHPRNPSRNQRVRAGHCHAGIEKDVANF